MKTIDRAFELELNTDEFYFDEHKKKNILEMYKKVAAHDEGASIEIAGVFIRNNTYKANIKYELSYESPTATFVNYFDKVDISSAVDNNFGEFKDKNFVSAIHNHSNAVYALTKEERINEICKTQELMRLTTDEINKYSEKLSALFQSVCLRYKNEFTKIILNNSYSDEERMKAFNEILYSIYTEFFKMLKEDNKINIVYSSKSINDNV